MRPLPPEYKTLKAQCVWDSSHVFIATYQTGQGSVTCPKCHRPTKIIPHEDVPKKGKK